MDLSSESPDSSGTENSSATPVEDRIKMSAIFQEFAEKIAALPTPEEKIAYGLQFMRSSISQEGSPRFREFWEARKIVLPHFKENLNPVVRSKLWSEYVELTVEARRLKEILEEQSAFAMEQIDLAIQSIEADLSNFESLLSQAKEIACAENSETLSQKIGTYDGIQRELNLLNTLASRLNALRKEVIHTDMRIRFKTKFFKRLSQLGDHIFPKRKQLIEEVSSEFEKDVDHFVAKYFQTGQVIGAPYYTLREEIKALQGMAKVFTLSSGVFNRTRMKLSECWDQIKVLEKEHKKEISEMKQASSEQRQAIEKKIEELKLKSADLSLRDLDQAIDEISREMRAVSLHRDDVRALHNALSSMRAPHIAAQEQKARELEAAERAQLQIKREKIAKIKEDMALLHKEAADLDLEIFSSRYDEIKQAIEELSVSKVEKQPLERMLRPLRDLLADKKEHSLINLSEDDRKTLENLRLVLQQKKERRQEIKDTLEGYRKLLGGSSLDFEKAMHLRELIDQEKERLEKANVSIQEIEDKIAGLEG